MKKYLKPRISVSVFSSQSPVSPTTNTEMLPEEANILDRRDTSPLQRMDPSVMNLPLKQEFSAGITFVPVTVKEEEITPDHLRNEQPLINDIIFKKESASPPIPHLPYIYPPLPLSPDPEKLEPQLTESKSTAEELICQDYILGVCNKEICNLAHRSHLTELLSLFRDSIPSTPLAAPPPPASSPEPFKVFSDSDKYKENSHNAPLNQIENFRQIICRYFYRGPCSQSPSKFAHERDCISRSLTNTPAPNGFHIPPPQTNITSTPAWFHTPPPQINRPPPLQRFGTPTYTPSTSFRVQTPQNVTTEPQEACREFMRGQCYKRPCKFAHKYDITQMRSLYTFCKDYQNGVCRYKVCRYVHATLFQESLFYRTGKLPMGSLPPRPPASLPSPAPAPLGLKMDYKNEGLKMDYKNEGLKMDYKNEGPSNIAQNWDATSSHEEISSEEPAVGTLKAEPKPTTDPVLDSIITALTATLKTEWQRANLSNKPQEDPDIEGPIVPIPKKRRLSE